MSKNTLHGKQDRVPLPLLRIPGQADQHSGMKPITIPGCRNRVKEAAGDSVKPTSRTLCARERAALVNRYVLAPDSVDC